MDFCFGRTATLLLALGCLPCVMFILHNVKVERRIQVNIVYLRVIWLVAVD